MMELLRFRAAISPTIGTWKAPTGSIRIDADELTAMKVSASWTVVGRERHRAQPTSHCSAGLS